MSSAAQSSRHLQSKRHVRAQLLLDSMQLAPPASGEPQELLRLPSKPEIDARILTSIRRLKAVTVTRTTALLRAGRTSEGAEFRFATSRTESALRLGTSTNATLMEGTQLASGTHCQLIDPQQST